MLSILICDDDKFIINKISALLKQYFAKRRIEFSILASTDPHQIYNSKQSFDLAYIDIEMPDINGLKLSQKLKQNNSNILIMIVTSFEHYLDDAMEIHVYRYLSKPIDENRFFINLESALKKYYHFHHEISFTYHSKTIRITTSDIIYITVSGHKSMIRTQDSQYYSDRSIKEWAKEINEPQAFAFSHSSYLVQLKYVTNFDKTTVTIRLGPRETEVLPMSQRKYVSFKKSFLGYMENAI